MDAAALRERRKARIQSAGTSRLSQITKVSNPDGPDYKDHKVPSLVRDDMTVSDTDTLRANAMPDSDPLSKLLSELGAGPKGLDGDGDAWSSMAAMFGAPTGSGEQLNPFASSSPGQQKQISPQAPDNVESLWLCVRFCLVLATAGYYLRSYNDDTSPNWLVWNYFTVEILVHSARFVIEKGSPPSNSMIATFASFLPNPFRQYLIMLSRYLRIGRAMVEDLCLGLFVVCLYFGVADVFSTRALNGAL